MMVLPWTCPLFSNGKFLLGWIWRFWTLFQDFWQARQSSNHCQAGGHQEAPNKRLPSKYRSTVQHEHPSTVRDTCCRSRVPQICCKCKDHLCYTWAYISDQEIPDRNELAAALPLHQQASSRLPLPSPPSRTHQVLLRHGGLLCRCPQQSSGPNTTPRLYFQTNSLSWYCTFYRFIEGLAVFVVTVVELLETQDCVKIVTFH